MGNLLNFNQDRQRDFSSQRRVDFDSQRELEFTPSRDLDFDKDRDLPFGKKGVMFRGYVCPACGSQVTETQETCDECGATLSGPAADSSPSQAPAARGTPVPESGVPQRPYRKAKGAPRKSAPPASVPAPPRSQPTAAAPPSPASPGSCSRCGARVLMNDTFCWSCGAKFTQSVSLPPAHGSGGVKEWTETGKDWKDFVER